MENVSAPPSCSTPRHSETSDRICSVIRSFGLPVTAAAVAEDIDRDTVSRWQQSNPGVALRFAQAREQFREAQLTAVMAGGKGWRAAAWLLEHVFPADYHPRAAERARFRQAEVESAAATVPAPSSETVLQNSMATPSVNAVPTPQMAGIFSEAALQNSAVVPPPHSTVHASLFTGDPSEALLQKSPGTLVEPNARPLQMNASPSEPVLQNPLRPGKRLSRKARRAVERNQHRAERLRAAAAAA